MMEVDVEDNSNDIRSHLVPVPLLQNDYMAARHPLGFLSVHQTAMRIHLISEQIYAFLGFHDLKTLRLVSKTWGIPATTELIKRNSCQIVLTTVGNHRRGKVTNLEHLNSMLQHLQDNSAFINNDYPPFPCISYKLNGRMDLLSVSNFFSLQGDRVKELNLFCPNTKSPSLKAIPRHLELCQNLTKLTLWESDILCKHMTLSFSSLRIFKCSKYPVTETISKPFEATLAFQIIVGSPNLQEVKGFFPSHINFFLAAGKTHLIKKLKLVDIETENDVDDVKKFADTQPKLQKLMINCFRDNLHSPIPVAFSNELTKILDSSKNSLKILWMMPLQRFYTDLQLPKLSALKCLTIHGKPTRYRIFVPEMNLQNTFPNLLTVTLDSMDYGVEPMERYFPSNDLFTFGSLLTVKRLEIKVDQDRPLSLLALEKFCEFFPNLKTLQLNDHRNIFEDLTWIFRTWNRSGLEKLVFDFRKMFVLPFPKYSFDPILTGISEKDCARLRESNFLPAADGVVELRERPSILNLTSLKIFTVRLDKPPANLVHLRSTWMSQISQLYALNFAPDLKVTIGWE